MADAGRLRPPADATTRSGRRDGSGDDAKRLSGAPGDVGRDTTEAEGRIAQVGSAFSGAETMQSQNTANGLTMKQNLSGNENDHVNEVVTLVAQQVAYEAALAATARAMTPSLTEFLR